MGRGKRKHGHNPDHFHCLNPDCARTTPLALQYYQINHLPEGVDPSQVHSRVDPSMGGFVLNCTCGHFTVVSRHEGREA